jgi:hypothetical protein
MTRKKINLGNYLLTIYHNENEGVLEIKLFDEENEMIEAIIINEEDDEEEETNDGDFNFNLN